MEQRHHIDSDEFEQWEAEVDSSVDLSTSIIASREELYDLWVQGYAAWEVEGIFG